MTSGISAAFVDSLHYDPRAQLTLDLDLDEDSSGAIEGKEKSTTLRSEDSGIVMLSEIQRDGKTRFPRSPGFHFGLDEELVRNHEEEIRGQVEQAEAMCPSPGTISISSEDSEFEISPGATQLCVKDEFSGEDSESEEWMTVAELKLCSPREEKPLECSNWENVDRSREKNPSANVDFIAGSPCTDPYKAVGILKTKYRLADVSVRKTNPTRVTGRPTTLDYIPAPRLYDRPQFEYFGSRQLKGITRDIEMRDRQLSILLSKILAEDEKAKREEEQAKATLAAAAQGISSIGPTWVVPELDFFSSSAPGASCDFEFMPGASKCGDNPKSPEDKAPESKSGVGEEPLKKRRSIFRRAIHGLRKSFSRRNNARA